MKLLFALVIAASLFLGAGVAQAHDEVPYGEACVSWEPWYYQVSGGYYHWHWYYFWWQHWHEPQWAIGGYVYHDHYYGWNCGFSP